MELYTIMRYYRKNKKPTIIATGQTLEDARRHCQREDTHKIDRNGNIVWFDGYTKQ